MKKILPHADESFLLKEGAGVSGENPLVSVKLIETLACYIFCILSSQVR